ncbi:hypothetical protein ACFL20_13545, partial [Spirochaetota bacterium]
IRWWFHRILAVLLVLISIVNIVQLIVSKARRQQMTSFILKAQDFRDLAGTTLYNLGFITERPQLGQLNYMKKGEYLAYIMLNVTMILTGAILISDQVFFQYVSYDIYNLVTVVHLYTAILASLVIITLRVFRVY